jgi:hypothetical protein
MMARIAAGLSRQVRWPVLNLLSFVVALSGLAWTLPLGKALSLRQGRRFVEPETLEAVALDGINLLAGDFARFQAGIALAALQPSIPLVLVTGAKSERVRALARKHGITDERMTFKFHSTTPTRRRCSPAGCCPGRRNGHRTLVARHQRRVHAARYGHAGCDVVPYPVFATEYPYDRHNLWLALCQWADLILYRARGRTDALLPWPIAAEEDKRNEAVAQ